MGIGDSATLRQINVIDDLGRRGNEVINPFIKELTTDLNKYGTFQRILRNSLQCDLFLTSVVSHKRLELSFFVLRERGNVQPG